MREDSALWEHEPKELPLDIPKVNPHGYADLYTWQPRLIFLHKMLSGGVEELRFIAGQGCENPSNISDPMQPYKIDKTHGNLPIQFRENRGNMAGL